jgi:hypothetical protein
MLNASELDTIFVSEIQLLFADMATPSELVTPLRQLRKYKELAGDAE